MIEGARYGWREFGLKHAAWNVCKKWIMTGRSKKFGKFIF